MVDKSGTVGNPSKRSKIALMVVALVLLLGGYVGNYYLVNVDVTRTASYLHDANQLKVLTQQIVNHGNQAAMGQLAMFPLLTQDRGAFDASLSELKNGNPVLGLPASPASLQPLISKVTTLWNGSRADVNNILGNRDVLVSMRDIASDLTITLTAIEQENRKVVAAMLLSSAPASEVVLAQRQSQLTERMSRSLESVLQAGGTQNLVDNFANDQETFQRVLAGLTSGDRELQIKAATNSDVRASLAKIEELYRSVATRSNEIFAQAKNVASVKQSALALSLSSAEFAALLDSLVDAYEDNKGTGIVSPMIGLGLALAAFFVMLVLGLTLARQARDSVNETASQNEQNQAAILQLLDELADLADGDLRVQATVTENFTGAIADSINFSIDTMRTMVSRINETSAEVATAADQTRNSVSQLSEASQRQAKEIADVSEAVNEMAVSIDQVSYNAAESSSVAERSVDIASKGAIVVQNTIGGMDKIRGQIQETAKRIKRLGESSQEIGDIVSLINDIADQTNILSLNAAIQASMAGDAGKGFAVVADEVQRLAERSGAAAKQISALVKTIQSDTNEAVSSMEQTTAEVVQGTRHAQDAGVSLGEIEGVSKTLAEIIENISDAARQQAASAGKISNTMKSIEEITSQTTEGTKSTATAVGNLADMTNDLRSSVTGFKLPSR
ncbi:MAG: twitching motility protein PilJ [Candidatus Pseudothioglobus sp.]|jgi:twitching motility protein PilJ